MHVSEKFRETHKVMDYELSKLDVVKDLEEYSYYTYYLIDRAKPFMHFISGFLLDEEEELIHVINNFQRIKVSKKEDSFEIVHPDIRIKYNGLPPSADIEDIRFMLSMVFMSITPAFIIGSKKQTIANIHINFQDVEVLSFTVPVSFLNSVCIVENDKVYDTDSYVNDIVTETTLHELSMIKIAIDLANTGNVSKSTESVLEGNIDSMHGYYEENDDEETDIEHVEDEEYDDEMNEDEEDDDEDTDQYEEFLEALNDIQQQDSYLISGQKIDAVRRFVEMIIEFNMTRVPVYFLHLYKIFSEQKIHKTSPTTYENVVLGNWSYVILIEYFVYYFTKVFYIMSKYMYNNIINMDKRVSSILNGMFANKIHRSMLQNIYDYFKSFSFDRDIDSLFSILQKYEPEVTVIIDNKTIKLNLIDYMWSFYQYYVDNRKVFSNIDVTHIKTEYSYFLSGKLVETTKVILEHNDANKHNDIKQSIKFLCRKNLFL